MRAQNAALLPSGHAAYRIRRAQKRGVLRPMRFPYFLARRFVAGESFQEALPAIQTLNNKGMRVTLDLLGERVTRRKVAETSRDAYIRLVRIIARERERRAMQAGISIKLSMIGQKIDEEFCLKNLRMLLEAAKACNVFVRLDMEGSDATASTLCLFEETFPEYPDHTGIVLQAYLKRTERDVERMCALKAPVRLCKGAYKEPPEIAWRHMPVIRERFMACAQELMTHGRHPGIATHDDELISATKILAANEGISRDRFEFQMLYGMRPQTQQQIVREGYRMRVYVPFGTQWAPYFARRLRERKENVWFALRNLARG